jgi:hypothetical protein
LERGASVATNRGTVRNGMGGAERESIGDNFPLQVRDLGLVNLVGAELESICQL